MDNLTERIEALEKSYSEIIKKIEQIENDKSRSLDMIIIENKLDMILEHLGLNREETNQHSDNIIKPDFSRIKDEINSFKDMMEHN